MRKFLIAMVTVFMSASSAGQTDDARMEYCIQLHDTAVAAMDQRIGGLSEKNAKLMANHKTTRAIINLVYSGSVRTVDRARSFAAQLGMSMTETCMESDNMYNDLQSKGWRTE